MRPPRRDFASEVTLPDGRTLAYAEYGDLEGAPVLSFHGTPGSRVSASVARETMTRAGVRLIAPERPGSATPSTRPTGRSPTGPTTWRR